MFYTLILYLFLNKGTQLWEYPFLDPCSFSSSSYGRAQTGDSPQLRQPQLQTGHKEARNQIKAARNYLCSQLLNILRALEQKTPDLRTQSEKYGRFRGYILLTIYIENFLKIKLLIIIQCFHMIEYIQLIEYTEYSCYLSLKYLLVSYYGQILKLSKWSTPCIDIGTVPLWNCWHLLHSSLQKMSQFANLIWSQNEVLEPFL